MPFGGLLPDVADHDGFLGGVLDGHGAEIDFVWEVEKCAATDGTDGHDKLFSLCNDRQIVGVINLGLGTKSNRILHLHPWGDTAAHDIYIRSSLSGGGLKFFYWEDLEKLRVRGDYLN